jgi:hypothetical protein
MGLAMKFLRTASETEVAQGGIPDEARPELGDRERSVPVGRFCPAGRTMLIVV